MRCPDHLRALDLEQHSVVRREQLHAHDLDDSYVRTQLVAGRWQAIGQTVVVLHNGPLTALQQQAAAVLLGGRQCGLAAWTAAESAGLRNWERPAVHVLVPRGTTYPVDQSYR